MVGFPVVSFLAQDDAKRKYVKEFKAFVPKDQIGFREYLNNAVSN